MFVYNRYYRLNLRGVKNALCNSIYYQIFNTMIKKTGILLIALTISYALFSNVFAQSGACEMANKDTTTVPTSPLLGSVDNAGLAVDGDKSTASSLLANVTLLGTGTVSQTLIFPTLSSFNDSVTVLLGYSGSSLQTLAQVSKSVIVETFNGTTSNGDAMPLSEGLIKVVNSGSTFTYGIRPAAAFDRIKFTLSPGGLMAVGASSQLDIYYACKGPYPISTSGIPLCTNASSVTSGTSGACVGCAVSNPNNAIDNNSNSFASMTVPVSLLGGSVNLDIGGFPTAGRIGDSIEVILGVDAALLVAGTNSVIIETLNGGVSNGDSVVLNDNALSVVDSNRRTYTMRPAFNYDAIRITVNGQLVSAGGGAMTSDVKVYGACKKDFIATPFVSGNLCISGDSTATEVTGNLPAPLPTNASVTSPANAIDNDATNYSTLNVTIGAAGTVSATQYIHFLNQGCQGDSIKATIQDNNGNPASVSTFGQYSLQLFNGTTPVGSPTTAGSPTVTAVQAANRTELKFAASDIYDGFKITLNSAAIAGAATSIRFFGVCAQPKTPPQIDTLASKLNICYNSSAVLSAKVPAGTTVEWYTTPTAIPSSLVFTGNVFNTPALTSTQTFYARTILTTGSGCSSNILIPYTVVVNRQLPAPTFTTNPIAICENTDVLLTAKFPVIAPPIQASINWYDAATGGTLLTIGANYRTPSLTTSTTYFVGADSAGCKSLSRTPITVNTAAKVAGPFVSCGSNITQAQSTPFQWTAVPGALTYLVDKGDGLPPVDNPSLTYNFPGQTPGQFSTIIVTAKTSDVCGFSKPSASQTCEYKGCNAYDVTFSAVNPNQCLPATVQFLNTTSGIVSWDWRFGDGATSTEQNPTHAYTAAGFYAVTLNVIDVRGCAGSQTEANFVQICDFPNVFFPTGFTPNGDNVNDTYSVQGGGIESIEIDIYNQWGQRVFESKVFGEAWDGKKSGDNMPEGTYVYYAKVKLVEDSSIKEYKGNITLIR